MHVVIMTTCIFYSCDFIGKHPITIIYSMTWSQLLTCIPCCCKALHLGHWRWNARVVSQKMVKISQRLKEKIRCLEKLNYRSKKKLFLFSQGGVKLSDPFQHSRPCFHHILPPYNFLLRMQQNPAINTTKCSIIFQLF